VFSTIIFASNSLISSNNPSLRMVTRDSGLKP
jgi:hypothetical protein